MSAGDIAADKVARAERHFSELSDAIDAFLAEDPYTVTVKGYAVPTGDQVMLRFTVLVHSEVPPEIAPIIGDVMFNLRSALDHLAYALVIANNKKPSARTEFPIFYSSDRFKGIGKTERDRWTTGLDKMAGMSKPAQALIESLQPYNARVPKREALWLLHELHITDKHHRLHPCGGMVFDARFVVSEDHGVTVLSASEPFSGPFVNGAEIAWCEAVFHGDASKMDVDYDFPFDVALLEAPPEVDGGSVKQAIGFILRRVGGEIIPKVRALL